MAAVVHLIDDLDLGGGIETPATQTVRIMLRDQLVELDLSDEHAVELDALLAPYLKVGRRPDSAPRPRPRGRANPGITSEKLSSQETAALREWADEHGLSYRTKGDGPRGTTGGNIYYGAELRRRWAAHKEAEGLSFDPPR